MKDISEFYKQIFSTIADGCQQVFGKEPEDLQQSLEKFSEQGVLENISLGAEFCALLASFKGVILNTETAHTLSDKLQHRMFIIMAQFFAQKDEDSIAITCQDFLDSGFADSIFAQTVDEEIEQGVSADEQSVGEFAFVFGDKYPVLISDNTFLNELFIFSLIADEVFGEKAIMALSLLQITVTQKAFVKALKIFINDFMTLSAEDKETLLSRMF